MSNLNYTATVRAISVTTASVKTDTKEADTVDGWHIAVRKDGTPPSDDSSGTLTFVYNEGS